MVSRKKSAVFQVTSDNPGYLDMPPNTDWGGPLVADNPDGTVQAYGLGPYEVGGPRGRDYSQGAGTDKGGVGSSSGKAKTMSVKGGSR